MNFKDENKFYAIIGITVISCVMFWTVFIPIVGIYAIWLIVEGE